MDMGELIEDLKKTKILPPAYHRIQDFLTNICLLFYSFIHSFLEMNICFFIFFEFFIFQVGADRIRPNTKPKVHTGIDLLFADVSENLRAPSISASSLDVPQWNK
jgi:hypothetical protein